MEVYESLKPNCQLPELSEDDETRPSTSRIQNNNNLANGATNSVNLSGRLNNEPVTETGEVYTELNQLNRLRADNRQDLPTTVALTIDQPARSNEQVTSQANRHEIEHYINDRPKASFKRRGKSLLRKCFPLIKYPLIILLSVVITVLILRGNGNDQGDQNKIVAAALDLINLQKETQEEMVKKMTEVIEKANAEKYQVNLTEWCSPKHNPGWTIAQCRHAPFRMSMSRTWHEYENGFSGGNETWIGLKKLQKLQFFTLKLQTVRRESFVDRRCFCVENAYCESVNYKDKGLGQSSHGSSRPYPYCSRQSEETYKAYVAKQWDYYRITLHQETNSYNGGLQCANRNAKYEFAILQFSTFDKGHQKEWAMKSGGGFWHGWFIGNETLMHPNANHYLFACNENKRLYYDNVEHNCGMSNIQGVRMLIK